MYTINTSDLCFLDLIIRKMMIIVNIIIIINKVIDPNINVYLSGLPDGSEIEIRRKL